MPPNQKRSTVPLPGQWTRTVKSAVLHVISLAHFAIAYTRGWAANSINARVRLAAVNDRLKEEVALLREELRIKDARMAQILPYRRPHYPPTERMAILELRAARAWSLQQTANAFLITAATISSWLARIDESGPDALVQTPRPVNKFPEFVGYMVRRLKALCPAMGKVKIAQALCRAGLHLGATTAGRMLKQNPKPASHRSSSSKHRVVTANYPNHVWHADLTAVPTSLGFWTSWLPFALPQCWPFCWWVAVTVDHFSRRAMGFAAFTDPPSSEAVRAFLARTMRHARVTPKYLVCDKGSQFWCPGFKAWCCRRGIRPRFGAIGQHGSIAVIERFILTMKQYCARLLVPLRREAVRHDLRAFVDWFNAHRPHMSLRGKTPDEVYHDRFPAGRRPRFEPRPRWPRGSPCARPHALVRGKPGARLELEIADHARRKHLPVVSLRRVA